METPILYVRWPRIRLNFEKGIQLPSLVLFCVFLAGFLDSLGKIMIIRDRMTLLMRSDNLLDFSFELVRYIFPLLGR